MIINCFSYVFALLEDAWRQLTAIVNSSIDSLNMRYHFEHILLIRSVLDRYKH